MIIYFILIENPQVLSLKSDDFLLNSHYLFVAFKARLLQQFYFTSPFLLYKI